MYEEMVGQQTILQRTEETSNSTMYVACTIKYWFMILGMLIVIGLYMVPQHWILRGSLGLAAFVAILGMGLCKKDGLNTVIAMESFRGLCLGALLPCLARLCFSQADREHHWRRAEFVTIGIVVGMIGCSAGVDALMVTAEPESYFMKANLLQGCVLGLALLALPYALCLQSEESSDEGEGTGSICQPTLMVFCVFMAEGFSGSFSIHAVTQLFTATTGTELPKFVTTGIVACGIVGFILLVRVLSVCDRTPKLAKRIWIVSMTGREVGLLLFGIFAAVQWGVVALFGAGILYCAYGFGFGITLMNMINAITSYQSALAIATAMCGLSLAVSAVQGVLVWMPETLQATPSVWLCICAILALITSTIAVVAWVEPEEADTSMSCPSMATAEFSTSISRQTLIE